MSSQILSASRIKTFASCSYLGYAKYVLKVPDTTNLGAQLGTITHTIAECCADDRRKSLVDIAYQSGNPLSIPSLKRLATKLLKQIGELTDENVNKVSGFLQTAFAEDFYGKGSISSMAEYRFDVNEEGRFRITGFIDRIFVYKSRIRLVDFKSSKQKMSKEERDFNIQGLMYVYVVHKLYPDIPVEDIDVDFLFLKFSKDPTVRLKFTTQQLQGFEEYLSYIHEHLTDFGIEKALADMACNDPKRKWLCGAEPFTFKETGEMKWSCPMRAPMLYFEASKSGEKSISAKTKLELDKYEQRGYVVTTKRYSGCPKWN